jgi:hypothetical protein
VVEPRLAPVHPHPFEVLLDKPLASALHAAAADGQSLLPKPRVVEVLAVRFQVGAEILQRLADRGSQGFLRPLDIQFHQQYVIDRPVAHPPPCPLLPLPCASRHTTAPPSYPPWGETGH